MSTCVLIWGIDDLETRLDDIAHPVARSRSWRVVHLDPIQHRDLSGADRTSQLRMARACQLPGSTTLRTKRSPTDSGSGHPVQFPAGWISTNALPQMAKAQMNDTVSLLEAVGCGALHLFPSRDIQPAHAHDSLHYGERIPGVHIPRGPEPNSMIDRCRESASSNHDQQHFQNAGAAAHVVKFHDHCRSRRDHDHD